MQSETGRRRPPANLKVALIRFIILCVVELKSQSHPVQSLHGRRNAKTGGGFPARQRHYPRALWRFRRGKSPLYCPYLGGDGRGLADHGEALYE